MINTSTEILFLKEGKALSDAVHEAISTVRSALADNFNFTGDTDSIRTKDESIVFLRFFDCDFHDENKTLSKDDVIKLYTLLQFSLQSPPTNEQIKELCLYTDDVDSKRKNLSRTYFRGIKPALTIMFLRLWREKALLLPYDFVPPIVEWVFEERFRDLFFTPVLSSVRMQNARFNPDLVYKTLAERRNQDCRAGYWLKLVLTSTWYESTDLTLDDLLSIRGIHVDREAGLSNNNLQLHLLAKIFIKDFGDKINFTEKDLANKNIEYYEALNSFNNVNTVRKTLGKPPLPPKNPKAKSKSDQLKEGLHNIYAEFQSLNVDELVKAITQLTITHLGNSKSTFENIYEQVLPNEYHKSVKYWLDMQRLYEGKKKYEDGSAFRVNMGLFNSYLFIYLPWWYHNHALHSKLPKYPDSLNNLNCEVFVNRWVETSSELPLDYIQFIGLISKQKDWTKNTHYGMLHPLLMFLRWCENKKRRLPYAKEFENLLDTDDLPQYTKYTQSKKTPLSRRVFKMFVRYCYALERFQSQLIERVTDGVIDSEELKYLGGVASGFIYLKDGSHEGPKCLSLDECGKNRMIQPRSLNLDEYGLDRPVVSFDDEGGEEYPIKSIYRFFTHNEYLVDGKNKTIIYPGDLHVCLLAMETGIRANHLRWLDLNTFDMRVNHKVLDDYLHPLTVNTDKVKTEPWVSTVSSSVIRICLEQKKWRSNISNSSFSKPVFYNGNKNSKFGAFSPLFSYSPTAGTPASNVDDCFLALLLSFDQFLRDHSFEEESMYRIRPVGQKYYGEINSVMVATKINKQGHEYTPLTYAKRTTVHACRNSVVKEKTRYLPESIVGKHITGQHERLVMYYNLRDPEDHYADQNLQWVTKPGEVNVKIPLTDEVLNLEIPSNQYGGVMQKGIEDDVEQAIDAYGLISIHLITDEDGNLKDGISMIKAKKHIKLASNPTHYCPFNNVCPKEIIEELGEMKVCPLCPYAISGINHLPAISAAKDTCREEFTDAKEKLGVIRKEMPTNLEMIAEAEDYCNSLQMHGDGWKYRENEIQRKITAIRKGFDEGTFTVGKPEFIANMLECVCFKKNENQAAYLLKRLRDCKAFPLLETKKIAANFEMAKRKLMAIKDPSSVFNFDTSMNPM